MMVAGLVTCIVPAYNAEPYVREAIDSIFAQTYRPIEVIVVDDGSTDATAAIVRAYPQEIQLVSQENQGPAAARNAGIALATGEFIAFLDADDVWLSGKLQVQITHLRSHPDVGATVTHIQNFWIPDLAEEEERFRDDPVSRSVPGFLTQTLVARASVFETVGILAGEAGAGDATEWFLRVFDQGIACDLIADTLTRRRLHHTNRSRGLGTLPRTVLLRFLKDSLDRRRGRGD